MEKRQNEWRTPEARSEKNATLEEVIQRLKASVLRLELTEIPRISAALDGQAANEEALRRLEQKVARLEKEMGRQAMEHVAFEIVN